MYSEGTVFRGGGFVKQAGCEVCHSRELSAEIKSEWSCTSVSPVYLRGLGRDFTFISQCINCILL